MNGFFFWLNVSKKDEKTFSILYLDLQKSFPPLSSKYGPLQGTHFQSFSQGECDNLL